MILRALTVLFLIQLALAAALYWPESKNDADASVIVDLPSDQINRITLRDAEGTETVIVRNSGPDAWVADELPVDVDRVNTLLNALTTQDPGYPIATSEAAIKRFRVGPDAFERELILESDAGEDTVYLGSSPSFRNIHASRDGETRVFVLELNSYDAPAGIDQWLDQTLLAQRQVAELRVAGAVFTSNDERWSRDVNIDFDQAALDTLLGVLENLRVTGTADPLAVEPTLRIEGAGESGPFSLSLYHDEENNQYFLSEEAYSTFFSTSSYDAERIADNVELLLSPPALDASEAEVIDAPEASETSPGEDALRTPETASP